MSLVRVESRRPGSSIRTNTNRSLSTQNCRRRRSPDRAPTTYTGRSCHVSSCTVARSKPSCSSRFAVRSAASKYTSKPRTMSGCTNAVAFVSWPPLNRNWESRTYSAPAAESAGWNSIRSRPGNAAYSSHVECSVAPSGAVAVLCCTNVSVRYHVPAYRSCIAATMARPVGGVAWQSAKSVQTKASIGGSSRSGCLDDQLRFRRIVGDPAQRDASGIPPRFRCRVRGKRDILPVDSSQPNRDPLLIAGRGGERNLPRLAAVPRPHFHADDVVRPKEEIELRLPVIQDAVHQQWLHATRLPVRQPPRESIGDRGQRDDRALVERGVDLGATGAVRLYLLQVRDLERRLVRREPHPTDGLHVPVLQSGIRPDVAARREQLHAAPAERQRLRQHDRPDARLGPLDETLGGDARVDSSLAGRGGRAGRGEPEEEPADPRPDAHFSRR